MNLFSKKIKFGIIGCSRVTKKSMLPALAESNFAEVGMIGSRDREKALLLSKEFGFDAYGNYEDILNDKSVDAVYISIPNALHEEWVIKAAEAGKHVLCEKPAAISYESAKRMVAAAKNNNVRLMEGLMFRYHPQHTRVMDLIAEGVLGDLLRFDGSLSFPMPDARSNIMSKDLGGGSFNDSSPYPIYASRMLFKEEPTSAVCKLKIDSQSGVDIKADMLLLYGEGKSAFVSTAFGSYFQSTYGILGSKAYLKMQRAYAVPRDMSTKIFLDIGDTVKEIRIKPQDHFRLMVDDFSKEILIGERSEKDYEGDLLAQAQVMEAGRISYKENRIVQIAEVV